MKLNIFLLQALMLLCCSGGAQTSQLKSTEHGLRMMLGDVAKEVLIDEMKFDDGNDENVNVVRFDHVGPNIYPLIVSSKLPVASDSLGILPIKLQQDTLYNLVEMIDNVSPNIDRRSADYVLIRVTYRFEGRIEQYYVTNAKIATGFLKMIEKKLETNNDPGPLEKFYMFIARMKLQKSVDGKRAWIYE